MGKRRKSSTAKCCRTFGRVSDIELIQIGVCCACSRCGAFLFCRGIFGTGTFPILSTHRQVPVVLAVGAGRFTLPLHWSLFFGRKYWEMIVEHEQQAIAFSSVLHLLHRKDSPAPAALAAGTGHYFPLSSYKLIL